MELSNVKKWIISSQSSTPNIVVVQDTLLGAYDMTLGFKSIDICKYNDIVLKINTIDETTNILKQYDINKLKNKQDKIKKVYKKFNIKESFYNGKALFSLILPDDFNYEHNNKADPDNPIVKIYKGVLYQGTLTKANLGGTNNSLILILHKEYGIETVTNFINNLEFITTNWLLHRGFSIGLGDCIATKTEQINSTIQKCFIKAKLIEDTTKHPGIREMRVSAALNDARNIGLSIAKESLSQDNGFIKTVTSGSKGDYFNIGQIMGLLGQQNLEGKRIPLLINQGRRSIPHYKLNKKLSVDDEYESRGFIKSNFIKGLNPKEFYMHCVSGREGVTDTAMKTAKSGYIQRRIVKCLEDIKSGYDGTVTDTVGSKYQLSYGELGLDPCKTININNNMEFIDINRLVNKINTLHEKLDN